MKEVGHIKRLMVTSSESSTNLHTEASSTIDAENSDATDRPTTTARTQQRTGRKTRTPSYNPEMQNLHERVAYYKNLYE